MSLDEENLNTLREINPHQLIEIDHEEDEGEGEGEVEGMREKTEIAYSKDKVVKATKSDHDQHHSYEGQHEQDDQHSHKHKHRGSHHGSKHGHKGKPKKNNFIIVYCVFTCLSCCYLQTQELNPYINDSKSSIMSYLSFFIVSMALWSYYQTIATSSAVTKIAQKDHLPYLPLKTKHCQKCDYMKVPRVSHCSNCGVCIYKLDHHCIWTQTCIGYCNQKPFYLFTVYMTLGVIQFWYSTARAMSLLSDRCHFFDVFEPGVYLLWGMTCFSAGVVGIMIVSLSIGHTIMIATNFTTLDSVKTKRVCPLPFLEPRKQYYEIDNVNSWDRGELQNLKSFFGDNILTWWLPFGRKIDNQFIFEPTSPFVIFNPDKPAKERLLPENIAKRLAGKTIRLSPYDTIPFDDL